MHSHSPIHPILACCFLLVLADGAMAAEIVECINSNGVITFRDVPCRAGDDAVRIFGPSGPMSVKEKVTPPAKNNSAAEHGHPTIRIKKVPYDHGLATDVATLKTAREVLESMDRLSKLTHQQALANID